MLFLVSKVPLYSNTTRERLCGDGFRIQQKEVGNRKDTLFSFLDRLTCCMDTRVSVLDTSPDTSPS